MIWFLNRKQLLVDTDSRELMRVKQILDANGIAYEVKTTTSDNVLSRNFNAKAAAHLYRSYSDMAQQSYVYFLYVRRRDHKKAQALISRKGN